MESKNPSPSMRVRPCRFQGLSCSSINFGPFAGVGMAASYADSMRAIGLHPLSADACPLAFSRIGYSGRTVRTRMDIARFMQVNQAKSKWSYVNLLDKIPQASVYA